jgi:hypothetical protein
MSHWRVALANPASGLAGKIDPRQSARASVQPAIPINGGAKTSALLVAVLIRLALPMRRV